MCHYYQQWENLTSDQEILQTVSGQMIEFVEYPRQTQAPREISFSKAEAIIIDKEISVLLSKGVVEHSIHEKGEYISQIFLRPKKDGSYRLILNLKGLNQYVEYFHFKMDTVWSAIKLMKPHCYMASVDLKDAYYSVSVKDQHRKFLKFTWHGQLYQYTCLPNGLALCPRKFTKLVKPLFSNLRLQGHLSSNYIDDSFLAGDSFEQCARNVVDTVCLLDSAGFVIHPVKSVLIPEKEIVFLGFKLNSVTMSVSLTTEKGLRIKAACEKLLQNKCPTIREVATVLGLMTSSFPAVTFGPLKYRQLEIDKTDALRENKGDFDGTMQLSKKSKQDLAWWISSIENSSNPISHGQPDVVLSSDASGKIGWGGVMHHGPAGIPTCGGHWSQAEAQFHINYLELLAVFLTLKSFRNFIRGKNVRVMVDNVTAVSVINHMGTSHSKLCNQLGYDIWHWCIEENIWLSSSHIPGKHNVEADNESRVKRKETEWMLDKSVFASALSVLCFKPNIDLFASRLNCQLHPYVSYRPNPEAYAVDSFTISWKQYKFYAFPPFSIIPDALQKIEMEMATGVIVVPCWPTQTWYPKLGSMLISNPVVTSFRQFPQLLTLPQAVGEKYPLYKTLRLLICLLSGDATKVKAFQMRLQNSCTVHGEKAQKNSTSVTSANGNCFVVQGKLIPFHHL